MSLLLRTHYKIAISSLRQNRTRSFLTCLGIAIGVASIILVLSLMGSIREIIKNQVKSIGADLIVVRPSTSSTQSLLQELTNPSQYLKSNLSLKDLDAIKKLDHVTAAAPIALSFNQLSAQKIVKSTPVLGTNPDFLKIHKLPLKSGNFLTENLEISGAIIGRSLAVQLFGSTEVIGQSFSLLGQSFVVLGVLNHTDDPINFNNINYDESAIIHIQKLKTLDDNLQIQQINIKSSATDNTSTTAEKVKTILTDQKSGDQNFTVAFGEHINHPAHSLFTIISGILALVAGISLIVGGIGIMNIMLVSVTERTHEIGIRKAVGASNANIFLQFLFESLALSFLGAGLGTILGYIAAFILSTFTPFAPFISLEIVLVTIFTSFAIGTLFGLYPAFKAARKDPISSLKQFI